MRFKERTMIPESHKSGHAGGLLTCIEPDQPANQPPSTNERTNERDVSAVRFFLSNFIFIGTNFNEKKRSWKKNHHITNYVHLYAERNSSY